MIYRTNSGVESTNKPLASNEDGLEIYVIRPRGSKLTRSMNIAMIVAGMLLGAAGIGNLGLSSPGW